MRSMPPLRALHAFVVTARTLSVSRAAEELHVTPSAISHQLKALETHLGVRLFSRQARRLTLTDTGSTYRQLINSVFDRIESATDHVINGGISDTLTVHCPPSFAPAWLLPRLPDFLKRNADIDVRLHATPEPPDFFRSDTDIEIRYGTGEWPGLIVVPLMEDSVTPLVAPSLRRQLPATVEPEDLHSLPLIRSERATVGWRDWFRANGVAMVEERRGLRFDRGYLSIQAAAGGLGVALESTVFAERDLASGALIKLFDNATASLASGGHFLVYPEAYAGIAKIRRFEAWIKDMAGSGSSS